VYRPHHRHRGVGTCTGGTWETGPVGIQGIEPGTFEGAGAGPGFTGIGSLVPSFPSFIRSFTSLLLGRIATGRSPRADLLNIINLQNMSIFYINRLTYQAV
jgi:hypothetical protein